MPFGEQNRGSLRFRHGLEEIITEQFWLHNVNAEFRGALGPSVYSFKAEFGLILSNISANGTLVRFSPNLINMLDLFLIDGKDIINYHNFIASLKLRLKIKGQYISILIKGQLVRTIVDKDNYISAALHFLEWGLVESKSVSWHKANNGHVQPIYMWIVEQQLTYIRLSAESELNLDLAQ